MGWPVTRTFRSLTDMLLSELADVTRRCCVKCILLNMVQQRHFASRSSFFRLSIFLNHKPILCISCLFLTPANIHRSDRHVTGGSFWRICLTDVYEENQSLRTQHICLFEARLLSKLFFRKLSNTVYQAFGKSLNYGCKTKWFLIFEINR